jgi:dethiobiotin synthetase
VSAAHAILITGTDTGVGKTLVACAVIAAMRARGHEVAVYKPAETGCKKHEGKLVGEDATRLLAAATSNQERGSATSYLFELPAAPLVAAEAAGATIDPQRIASDFARLARSHERVVVEGAGGLLVPLAEGYTYLDLARDLELSVICVVGSRLGCINHALLTLGTLERSGVDVRGFVVNQLEGGSAAEEFARSNRATIARFTHQRDLGSFPFVLENERDDYRALARTAATALDPETFL